MSVFDMVRDILIDQLGLTEDDQRCMRSEITLDTKIVYDLGADSLDAIELVLAFEDHFNIEIPNCDEDLTNKTVADVVAFISAQQGGR